MRKTQLLHCLRKLVAIIECILKRSVLFCCWGWFFFLYEHNSATNAAFFVVTLGQQSVWTLANLLSGHFFALRCSEPNILLQILFCLDIP